MSKTEIRETLTQSGVCREVKTPSTSTSVCHSQVDGGRQENMGHNKKNSNSEITSRSFVVSYWTYANANARTCTCSQFSSEVVKVSSVPLYTELKTSVMEDLCSRYSRACHLRIITSPIFFNCTLPSLPCHPITYLILEPALYYPTSYHLLLPLRIILTPVLLFPPLIFCPGSPHSSFNSLF